MLRNVLPLAAVLAGAVLAGFMFAQQSKPAKVSGETTEVALNKGKDFSGLEALQRIERQLDRSLGGDSRKSLEGLMAPAKANRITPPAKRQVLPSRRELDELEKRKNWMYLQPEDYDTQTEDKDKKDFLSRDGLPMLTDEQNLTPMERLYLRLGGTIPGYDTYKNKDEEKKKDDKDKDKDTVAKDKQDSGDSPEDELPGSLGDTAKKLRKLLEDQSLTRYALGVPQEKEDSLFGLGTPGSSGSTALMPQKDPILEQYQSMLQGLGAPKPSGGPSVPGMADSLNSLGGMSAGSLGPREALAAQVNALSRPAAIPTITDPSTKALNSWNPLYTPPSPQLPKTSTPKPLSFDAPRRSF